MRTSHFPATLNSVSPTAESAKAHNMLLRAFMRRSWARFVVHRSCARQCAEREIVCACPRGSRARQITLSGALRNLLARYASCGCVYVIVELLAANRGLYELAQPKSPCRHVRALSCARARREGLWGGGSTAGVRSESPGRSCCGSEICERLLAIPYTSTLAPTRVGVQRRSARQARIRCRGAAGRWSKLTGH